MSEKTTIVKASGGEFMLWGHVEPESAIEQFRRFEVVRVEEATQNLNDIATGDVEVVHQRGVHVARDRRLVWPVAAVVGDAPVPKKGPVCTCCEPPWGALASARCDCTCHSAALGSPNE